jgi:dTDP-4-amino-4,6-dideoxygalactose transaminase
MTTIALPAILGGRPAVTAAHGPATAWPRLGAADEAAVLAVLRSGNISTHPVIRELEHGYAAFTGRPFALAHCNGTAALLAAFFAAGLGPGDEVLVPTATFWASVLPMAWLGAVPVFCESEPERLGIDPVDMARKITPRTRAVVVVHLWGLPSKMTEIRALAAAHKLTVIEDASHAHGASWRGIPCGALGDLSVFSLQGDKLAPGGEGGVLLGSRREHFERAACLGDITRIRELASPARRFAATGFGMKTRIAPLSAAVALGQLRRLEEHNARRNRGIDHLSQALEQRGFHTFRGPAHVRRVYFEFIVRCDRKRLPLSVDLLIAALRMEGCRISRPRYPLLHQQPFFTEGHFHRVARLPAGCPAPVYAPDALPQTARAAEALLRLPAFADAGRDILDQYVAAFDKVLENAGRIAGLEGDGRRPLEAG